VTLEVLEENYQRKRKDARVRSNEALQQKSAVDFITAFFLLQALGDAAALAINANKLVGLAKARDSSVFAHGFELPTEANAKNLFEILTTLIQHGNLPEVKLEPIPLA
jgi:hypothetical protein